MTAMEHLEAAIKRANQHPSPKSGPTVVAAYKAGELYSTEECLYVIAALLDELTGDKTEPLGERLLS